jgi:hypothetical protein
VSVTDGIDAKRLLLHRNALVDYVFKNLEILPVPSQYIYSLMNFFVSNQENF